MNSRSGQLKIKIVIFLIVFVFAFLIFSFFIGKRGTVGKDEVGILVSKSGAFKLYGTGEKPFFIPFLEEFHTISTKPAVLFLVDEEGVKLISDEGKEVLVECQVAYEMNDVEVTIEKFGFTDIHAHIKPRIRDVVSELLKERFFEHQSMNDPQQRVIIMAELHVKLNKIMKRDGINITSFQIRHK